MTPNGPHLSTQSPISDSPSDSPWLTPLRVPATPTVTSDTYHPSLGSLKSSPSMSHMEVLGKAWNRQLR